MVMRSEANENHIFPRQVVQRYHVKADAICLYTYFFCFALQVAQFLKKDECFLFHQRNQLCECNRHLFIFADQRKADEAKPL